MKWWFLEKADIETRLSAQEIMARIHTIAREKHKILETLNPDHQFNDDYKQYVGHMSDHDFRLRRKYYTLTSRGTATTPGILLTGHIDDDYNKRIVHFRFTMPPINLLWFLFPPLWMMIGAAIAGDISLFHGIPVFTIICLLLLFYFYWMVLAQFRRKASGVLADFQSVIMR